MRSHAILDAWKRHLSFTLKVSKFPTSGSGPPKVSRPAQQKTKFYVFFGYRGSQITTSMQFTFRLIQFSSPKDKCVLQFLPENYLQNASETSRRQAAFLEGPPLYKRTAKRIQEKFNEDFSAENASDSRPKRTIFRSSQSHATTICSERG